MVPALQNFQEKVSENNETQGTLWRRQFQQGSTTHGLKKKNKVPIHATNMEEPEKHDAKWWKPNTKGHILYSFMDTEGREQANPERQ